MHSSEWDVKTGVSGMHGSRTLGPCIMLMVKQGSVIVSTVFSCSAEILCKFCSGLAQNIYIYS